MAILFVHKISDGKIVTSNPPPYWPNSVQSPLQTLSWIFSPVCELPLSRPQTIGIPNDFPTTFEDRLGGDFKCNETQLLLPSSSRDQRKRTFVSQEKPGKERTSKVSQRRECSNLTIYIHYKVLFEIQCGFSEQRIASRTYVGTVDW